MSIYILNLIVVSVAGLFAERTSKVIDGKKKYNLIFIAIATISLICVSGFRYKVGTDYGNYSEIFIYLAGGKIEFTGGEFGMDIILNTVRQFTANPQLFFMITSIIINVGFVIFMVKNTDNIALSLYFYITTFMYYLTMNGIRQYIASVILVLGYKHLVSGNFKKYIIYVICGMVFHSSCFIMIPVYFIVRKRSNSVWNVAILMGTVFALLFYQPFLEILFELLKYTNFYYYKDVLLTDVNGANPIRMVVWFAPVILTFMYLERARKVYGKEIDIILNLCYIGAIFMVLATKHVFFARVTMYFDVYYLLLLPKLCNMFESKTNKILTVILMIAYLGYSTMLLLSGDAWIYPYKYNLNLF